MSIQEYVHDLGRRAREASRAMLAVTSAEKNEALLAIADELASQREQIKAQNQLDLDAGRASKLDSALLDRLALDDQRIDGMIEGLRQVVALPDPCGEVSDLRYRPSGIQVGKQRVPLGVVAIIYESRPNVTIDAASLCLKSGNAGILRGGKESIHSNRAIAACIKAALARSAVPEQVIQVVDTTDRDVVGELITLPEYIDVVVPRGGKGLIERISAKATVNVIKHLDGICHVYVDKHANIDKALAIAVNSKTHRYGVCNAMETLLVHGDIAEKLLPQLAQIYQSHDVELRGCERTRAIVTDAKPALAEDWDTEYLAPILSIKIVDDFDQAVSHINTHSSAHTDAIVTEDYTLSRRFTNEVDSSSVMVNASTRFADGFEYGLGAEIGISTDKIHARGPVGLEGLTSQKWVVFGDGHIRT